MSSGTTTAVPKPARTDAVLDHSEVQFFLRRLVQKATDMFYHFRDVTNDFVTTRAGRNAQTSTAELENYWRANLPSISIWNTLVQRAIAEEFKTEVPNIETCAEFSYLLYCRSNYGRDAYGNVNILRVVKPPFSELFHAFLTRLALSPEMTRGAALQRAEDMERACRNALCDALHDVSAPRVTITESMTPAQWRASQRRVKKTSLTPTPTPTSTSIPASTSTPTSIPASTSTPTSTSTLTSTPVLSTLTATTPPPPPPQTPILAIAPDASAEDEHDDVFGDFKNIVHESVTPPHPKLVRTHTDTDVASSLWKNSLLSKSKSKITTPAPVTPRTAAAAAKTRITSDDSSSQVHSLGIRHQQETAAKPVTASLNKWRTNTETETTTRRVTLTKPTEDDAKPPKPNTMSASASASTPTSTPTLTSHFHDYYDYNDDDDENENDDDNDDDEDDDN